MKIIPHPALLRQKEEQLRKAQSDLDRRARELHILEIMMDSQARSEKRKREDAKAYQFALFLLGIVLGSLSTLFIS
tara:strand:- start:358 stop:585 length:228 start_codon:yes stop_codon:yes gene_type:complete